MKILFDLSATQPANGIMNHGGGEYARAVFMGLCEENASSVSVYYDPRKRLDSDLEKILECKNIKSISPPADAIKEFIINNGINIFYSALPRKEFLPLVKLQSGNFKVIFTIHGLRQLEMPYDSYEWFYLGTIQEKIRFFYKVLITPLYRINVRKFYKEVIKASHIVTVSEYSRNSLVKTFPGSGSKIKVFYSPAILYDPGTAVSDAPAEPGLKEKEYFLIVSGSLWIKNSYRAVRAFDNILEQGLIDSRYKMVVAGMKSSIRTKNPGNFIFTGYLERENLELLYKNALALVYPTLNEGFGYPPLECMKYEVPVIISGIGPLVEVCADAAIYIRPREIKSIMQALVNTVKRSEILFSEEEKEKRYNRYNIVKSRQKDDLVSLINIICNG